MHMVPRDNTDKAGFTPVVQQSKQQQAGWESGCTRSLQQPARPPHSENSDSSSSISSRGTGSGAAAGARLRGKTLLIPQIGPNTVLL